MLTLRVTGMTCEHCVRTVTTAVKNASSAEEVLVDLPTGTVTVSGHPDTTGRKAIVEEGYRVAD